MLPFHSDPTEFFPRVELSSQTGVFEISGVSRPENGAVFYARIIEWLNAFELACAEAGRWPVDKIIMNFRLTYCNSSSTKYIFQILEILLSWKRFGIVPEVNWYYDESDDKMRDDGQDLADALDSAFNFYPFE
jgi:hypothetical protein